MSNDTKFINGLIVKAPNDNAPEYVKAKLSIKREELIAWLQSEDGEWVNADIKVSQTGKWYVAVDNWKPSVQRQEPRKPVQSKPSNIGVPFDDSEIPF